MMRMLCLALAMCSVAALRLQGAVCSSRTTGIRMGLSRGDTFPADALEKFGVAGNKAVLFFYGADDVWTPRIELHLSAFRC